MFWLRNKKIREKYKYADLVIKCLSSESELVHCKRLYILCTYFSIQKLVHFVNIDISTKKSFV